MIARPYRASSERAGFLPRPGSASHALSDAEALDSLIDHNRAGNVRLDSDRIILVEPNLSGPVVGALIWRPIGFIHELVLSRYNVARRAAADTLVSYAMAEARSRQYDIRSSLFLVDEHNSAMLRFVREIGATEQPGRVFTFSF